MLLRPSHSRQLENKGEKMFCRNCGSEIDGGWKFCRNCGNPAAATSEEPPHTDIGGTPVPGLVPEIRKKTTSRIFRKGGFVLGILIVLGFIGYLHDNQRAGGRSRSDAALQENERSRIEKESKAMLRDTLHEFLDKNNFSRSIALDKIADYKLEREAEASTPEDIGKTKRSSARSNKRSEKYTGTAKAVFRTRRGKFKKGAVAIKATVARKENSIYLSMDFADEEQAMETINGLLASAAYEDEEDSSDDETIQY